MWKKALLSVLHGIFTLLLLWWYVNINYVTEPEEKEIQFFNWLSFQAGHTDTGILNHTVLVNTANELELIDDPMDYGKMVITDRQALTRFFHAVNLQSKAPRLIICDILFDEATSQDSLLGAEMERLPQLVIPFIMENGYPTLPIFTKNRRGLAQYYSHDEKMVKFQLVHPENLKTLPVVADEWVNRRNYEKTFFGTLCAGRLALGSVIPTYFIRPHMIQASGAPDAIPGENAGHPTLPLYSLHDLTIGMGDSLHDAGFLENKFLVIGNFGTNDQHHTPIGIMPGVLILYNTFLTLHEGKQFISLSWLIFIAAMFSLLSYLVFFRGFPHYHFGGSGPMNYLLHSFLLKFMSVAFFVSLVSWFSYRFYHTHVNILFISLYYSLINDFIKYWKDEKSGQTL
jgi:hypothetical protein